MGRGTSSVPKTGTSVIWEGGAAIFLPDWGGGAKGKTLISYLFHPGCIT